MSTNAARTDRVVSIFSSMSLLLAGVCYSLRGNYSLVRNYFRLVIITASRGKSGRQSALKELVPIVGIPLLEILSLLALANRASFPSRIELSIRTFSGRYRTR